MTVLVPSPHGEWFRRQDWPHLSWRESDLQCSPELIEHAGKGHALIHIGKACSCGWFEEAGSPEDGSAARAKAMQKKGWSAEKVQRALSQSDRAKRRRSAPTPGFRDPINDVVRSVAAHTGVCGVIAEWTGGKDAVLFRSDLIVRCSSSDFNADPERFVYGRLFWVTPDPAAHPRSAR